MRALNLPCARGPETLARVVQAPQVQVAHLWAFDGDDARHRPSLHGPRVAAADRHDVLVDQAPCLQVLSDATVEVAVEVEAARCVRIAVQPHRETIVIHGRGMLPVVQVTVTTWSLEMTSPSDLRPVDPPDTVEIRRAFLASPELGR